jgi:hypothetical protein
MISAISVSTPDLRSNLHQRDESQDDLLNSSHQPLSYAVNFGTASRPIIQPSRTWPVRQDSTAAALSSSYARRERIVTPGLARNQEQITREQLPPPPPPPKDPGYIGRPRRLRNHRSTSHLPTLSTPGSRERARILGDHSGATGSSPTGSDQSRERLHHHWAWLPFGDKLSQRINKQEVNISSDDPVPREHFYQEQTPTNRHTKLLVACARFVGRAMPKVAGHNKGSC